jgi:hypothetical protein
MKTIFFIAALMVGFNIFAATSNSEKTYTFKFRTIKEPISKKASSEDQAFKLAAKDCFNQLTGGKYPGEEKGLNIIDICANPKM